MQPEGLVIYNSLIKRISQTYRVLLGKLQEVMCVRLTLTLLPVKHYQNALTLVPDEQRQRDFAV